MRILKTGWTSGYFSSVQSLNCVRLCDPMDCSTPGFPVHHQLPELTQTHIHRVGDGSNYLILCCPFLFPPSIFLSTRVFSNMSVLCIRWPKYWSFSFSISPSNEYSGLISFRIDWLDLFAVQGTLKSLLQHHSSKASILQCSAFHSVVSDSLRPHGLQHARLPPRPSPGACSDSCPSSQWCHPTILSSVIPFSCLQFFPASGSFPMSQFFTSGS